MVQVVNMLYRVMGAAGSGKTEYMLSSLGEALKKGKRCFVIVPEQQSVAYEAMLCDRFGDSVNMLCEVLNFERLPNRVARDFGDLAVNNIDKGGACALLSLVAENLKPSLKEYFSVASDPDFAQSLYALVSRMKMALVTPDMISSAAENNTFDDNRLVSKLQDIALIYAEYEKHFSADLCDPRDSLTRLANELPRKEFFKNSCVFIDSYYTFTEQEYSIIKEIIAQSSNTYISFTVDSNRSFFDENASAAERIKKLSCCGCEDYYTADPKRALSPSLRFIERNIWQNGVGTLSGDDGSVRFVTAKNRFDEVEAAASEILSFVRSGGRYRDITVLAGNTDTYSSIIDSVFSRAGIPCYLSAKEPLAVKSLFSFVMSTLSVVIENFSLRSVKRYIKSGYTDLTASEADTLLSYATSWNLHGKAWYSDDVWTYDPEGYRESDISPRGARILKIANGARDKVVPPLAALRDTLSQKGLTVKKGLSALYEHLETMQTAERLRQNAEKLLNNGEREKSEREIQLWKILINIIDQLIATCGDREVTPKRLLALIRLMCDCYSLGAIPASADSVTFGSADLIRAGGSKMVIVLGVCDGEFPSSASHDSFFDREEAVALEGAGLYLADTVDKQLNTGRFFAYAALSAPTDRLVLMYPRSELTGEERRPSTAWISVRQMLPDVKETDFSETDMLYSREAIAAFYPSLAESELKQRIKNALEEKDTDFYREYPSIRQRESHIDFDENLLRLSPSRFERYILCPFSYFGTYLLELKEKKKNEFSTPEMGNFIHKILDQFMRECTKNGSFAPPADRKELVETLAQNYLEEIIGDSAETDKRFIHIFGNMVKTLHFVTESLVAEFKESSFIPSGFEYKIGLRNADIPAIEYDVNGKRVMLRGSIDRVDTYERDGVRYVRVIDYKTYSKTFSLDLVEHGIDTQLLHYLFAYCDKNGAKPAGALYYTVTLPEIKITGRETEEEIRKQIADSIERDGILIDNSDIVFAMSPSCDYIPVTKNSDGGLRKNKRLIPEELFGELSEKLKNQVESLAGNVFDGKMDIAPNDCDGKKKPCEYCPLGDICRMKDVKEDTDVDDNEE